MICLARQRADFPVVNPRAEMPVEQSNGFGKPVENIRFFFGGGASRIIGCLPELSRWRHRQVT
ncbi:hypothetical protein EK3BL_06060 [Bifidobacterium longum subsp. infantis EK3]|nr:hypothetical protein EK3BL_06060 [Bifidobacterium longum subsp. infantis EK3]